MAKPWFWLLAGPDGSGKSTLASSEVFARMTRTPESTAAPTYLNPDSVAATLRSERSELTSTQAWRMAAERTDAEVTRLVKEGRSLVVETILSTPKFEPIVEDAKSRGFLIGLAYIILQRPSLHMERVAQRVGLGGHDVGGEKVIERWVRSLGTLPWFAERADYFTLWDNSVLGGAPKLLIEATPQRLFIDPATTSAIRNDDTHPSLAAALQTVVSKLSA
jgi:predicted ABC-type ATPase